jgi:RNA polymerase sigma factor (sigma-70 family)
VTTSTTTGITAGATTASVPDPHFRAEGRPDPGAARARTEELYALHHRVVLALCRALLRDRAEAEDAAQQTFLSAHRALVNGSEPRESAAWLATIARNECWARIRSRMREPLPSADLDQEQSLSDPVAEAIRRADLAALWQAIRELPPQQREALLLREFGGLSYEELGAALAVSTPAVESLLFRARAGLRTRLRTAYAAVGGAGWAEWLARLVAGGSAPAAAKVAAVGMSAAVVTGGAVVTPTLLHHPTRHHFATTTTTTTRVRSLAPAPVLVVRKQTQAVAPVTQHTAASDDHTQAKDDHAQATDSRRDEHDTQAAENDGEHRQSGTTSAAVREHDTQEPADAAAPEHGKNEPEHSGDGEGVAPTTPNPVLTVTVPVAAGTPESSQPEPLPGSDD